MKRILITGMSGAGKSTVIEELARRGYKAVDADYDGLSGIESVPGGELTGLDDGRDWVWREDRMQALLSAEDAEVLFVGGCSPNQGKFYTQFDHVVLLSAPASVLAQRLQTRTNNPFGRDPDELARTLELQQIIEPALRRSATLEIDSSQPLPEVVTQVLRLLD